jgi:integrase
MWYLNFFVNYLAQVQLNASIKSFVTRGGERYCLLVDKHSGLPLYYPNLFLTTQVRNKSLSYSAMESALGGIAVLLGFMAERNANLEARFRQNLFFESYELDAIRDYCQNKVSIRKENVGSAVMFNFKELREVNEKVGSHTTYVRLTIISRYVKWLAELLAEKSREKNVSGRIGEMAKGIEARRPIKRNRNKGLVEKGLDKKQIAMLFELFRPESKLNPFNDISVRVRNRLIFLLLYHLGLRSGELLNIRIRDIDFARNQLVVVRRADEKDDPRTDQPLAKTRDRRLPLKDTLAKEIHNYILHTRKKIVRPGQPDFLFVTHKAGPTKGLPISKSGYKKVLEVVRVVSPALYNFTGHQLRHAWNEQFSELMDSMDHPLTEERQEEMRSHLMGWIPGSGTAAVYNKRFTRRKAHEAALKLQEDMVRLPEDMSRE